MAGRWTLRTWMAVLLTACFCTLAPASAADLKDDSLSFGLLGVQSEEDSKSAWRPLLDALSQAIAHPVRLHASREYADIIWGLRQRQDHLAWLGNKSAMEAVDHAEADIFARKTLPGGEPGYHSLLLVKASSPYNSLDDLFAHAPHLILGLGDRNSTSGYLVPSYLLLDAKGTLPGRQFRRMEHRSHGENIQAVLSGQVDAAFVASDHFDVVASRRPGVTEQVRVLWRSPLIPTDPLVWRRDLPDELKAQIRHFFLTYGSDSPGKSPAQLRQERAVLANIGCASFVASDNSQLLHVRQIDLFHRRLLVDSELNLDLATRERRLAELQRQIDELAQQAQSWGKAP